MYENIDLLWNDEIISDIFYFCVTFCRVPPVDKTERVMSFQDGTAEEWLYGHI